MPSFEDVTVTTSATSGNKLGYYGAAYNVVPGKTILATTLYGSSDYKGRAHFIKNTQNQNVVYVETETANTYTVRVLYI